MNIQMYYHFNPESFDEEGIHKDTKRVFFQEIDYWEADFHLNHPHCYANYLFANASTMKIIANAMNAEPNQVFGMELINGQIDMDTNMEIENHSRFQTIYALCSKIEGENFDEPIFLISSPEIANGCIILKYIDEDEAEVEETSPRVVQTADITL